MAQEEDFLNVGDNPAAQQPPANGGRRYAWQNSPTGQALGQQVAASIKQNYGRDATDDDIWGQHLNWGSMPDSHFMTAIQNNIANSDEAKKYRASLNAPTQTTPTQPTQAATGSPVTANGQIPPPAPQTAASRQPLPTWMNNAPPAADPRTQLSPVDLSGSVNPNAAQAPALALPNQQGQTDQQNALLNAIMQNPGTMNPNVVAQMKEAQKEQALLLQQQQGQQFDQSATARGVLGGGQNLAAHATAGNEAANSILSSNRNTDIAAAQTNRADELNALAASSGVQKSQLDNILAGHNAQLADTQFNAGQDQQHYQNSINQLLAQFGINQGVAQNAQQNRAQDLATQLGYGAQQLDTHRFLEGQHQFDNTMGFNWAQLGQQGQQSLMQWLLQSGALGG